MYYTSEQMMGTHFDVLQRHINLARCDCWSSPTNILDEQMYRCLHLLPRMYLHRQPGLFLAVFHELSLHLVYRQACFAYLSKAAVGFVFENWEAFWLRRPGESLPAFPFDESLRLYRHPSSCRFIVLPWLGLRGYWTEKKLNGLCVIYWLSP